MRIKKEETAALFIDLQERLIPAMRNGAETVQRNAMLLAGLGALSVPAVFLRQYPKGLGDIVPELREGAGADAPFDKLAYSAMMDEAIAEKLAQLRESGIRNILVTGVEGHICVLQTCIDLVAAGFQPLLVADCVASRSKFDLDMALHRAIQEGALITTAEAALFELCQTAGTDAFKTIAKLVR